MQEVKGSSPSGEAERVIKVYVRENGRADLWICPPSTGPTSTSGWTISDVSIEELLEALKQRPATGW